jgi:hypothetical protein
MSSKASKSTSKVKSSSKKVAAPAAAKKTKKTAAVVVETVAAAPVVATPAPVVLPEVKDVVVEATPTRLVSRGEFLELVRKEAYQRAARRNFRNGSPFQDWVHAEAHVSGVLAAQGARLS